MGRTILVEEKLERELGRLTAAQSVQIGLLIGQVTAQRDYVTLFIRTPSLKELGRDEGMAAKSDQSLFDDWWVVEHSKEVSVLLPGGLSVVGLFLVCPTDLLKSFLPRLRKLLMDTTSQQLDASPLPSPPHTNMILLHTCLRTKKHKAQTVDLSDPQAGFRPAELKFQPHCSRWHRLDCSLALHLDTFVPSPSKSTVATLHKSMRSALQPTLEAISNSLVTLRGRVCQADDPLARPTGQRKSQTTSSGETVQSAMFLRTSSSSSHGPQVIPQSAHLRLNGSIRCLAYVHPKATCGEAIAAVRQDAVRSLMNRVEIACRDTEGDQVETAEEEERTDPDPLHCKENSCEDVFATCQLPTRVMVTIATVELPLSAYSFPNETEEELRGNLGDLLGVEPVDVIVEQLEKFPAPPTQEKEEETVNSETDVAKGSLVPVVSITAAVSLAVVAVALWFIQNMNFTSVDS